MAELSTADRQRIWRGLMRYWSNLREESGVSKAELQTTVNETDTWLNDNRASYLAALTYDGDFAGDQLTLLLAITALMRKGEVDLIERALSVEAD